MPDIEDEEEALLPDDEAKEIVRNQMTELTLALDGELRPLTPAVYVPPGVRIQLAENKTAREIIAEQVHKAAGGEVSYEDEVMRINRELDPVGMAIAIVQGMQIPVYVPQAGGGVKMGSVAVSTRERMKLLTKLLDRQLPPQSPRKQKKEETPGNPDDPFGFLNAVERAAALARQRLSQAKVIEGTVSETRDANYEESDLVERDT